LQTRPARKTLKRFGRGCKPRPAKNIFSLVFKP
jgi:hypothetical protein